MPPKGSFVLKKSMVHLDDKGARQMSFFCKSSQVFFQVCNIFAVHISEMDWNAMYHCHPCLFFFVEPAVDSSHI